MEKMYSCRYATNSASLEENIIQKTCELWNTFNGSSLSKDDFIKRILNGRYELILAMKDLDVVGFVLNELVSSPLRVSSSIEIWALYVSENHRKKGVGKMLLEEVSSFGKNCDCFDIHVSSDIKPYVINFYRSCGYSNYAIRMRKGLK